MIAFATVFAAVAQALRDLTRREILLHVLWPPLLAVITGVTLGVVFWSDAHAGVLALLPTIPWSGLEWLGDLAVGFLLLATLAALIYCTALVLVGAISLPLMMARVAARDYPDLQRHGENAFWGGVVNTLVAGAIFALGWLVTLPLLLIPGVVLVQPLAWTAWLNQRAFRFDALAEHATAQERKLLSERERGSFALAGFVTALAAAIPIVNLIAPGFAALVFVHLGLGALRRLRREQGVEL